jgi:hypothetical protein
MPPCYDENGRLIPQTKFGAVYFQSGEERDLAFLFLNGKIMFDYWGAVGDDFDVTRWMFADFPLDISSLPTNLKDELLRLSEPLEKLMTENTSFKLNAGKKVGNFNLAKCRAVTDKSDQIYAEFLQLREVWSDIELMYFQLVRTDFGDANGEE